MIKINFFLFSSFLFIHFCFGCSGQNMPDCEGFVHETTIEKGGAIIKYKIDSNFVYKYQIFEGYGPLASKKYGIGKDTLYLSWYYNESTFNDTFAIETIKKVLSKEEVFYNNHSFKHMEFGQLEGVLSETSNKNMSKMVFYGINRSTDKLLFSTYDFVNTNNRDLFFCVLKSMTFKDSSDFLNKD